MCRRIRMLYKVLIIFGIHIFYTKVTLVSINKMLLSNFKQYSTVSAVNIQRSDQICEYRSVHKITTFSSSAVKRFAINAGAKYR